jgi:hypothetical protein
LLVVNDCRFAEILLLCRTSLKTESELRCSERLNSSCSVNDTRRVTNSHSYIQCTRLSFCSFSFGHCVVCPSIYGLWLPLSYLQALLQINQHLSWENTNLLVVNDGRFAEILFLCRLSPF